MFLAVLMPKVLEQLAQWVGILNYLNGLFAIVIFALMIMLMALTSIVSELSNKNRTLVQECALLDERIRMLEKVKEGNKNA